MRGGYLTLIKGLFGRKTVDDDPYQMPDAGRLGCADRAGRASPEPFGLGHSATITDAKLDDITMTFGEIMAANLAAFATAINNEGRN